MEEDEKSWTEERRDWRRKKKESVSFRWAIPNRKEVSAKGDSRKRDEIKAVLAEREVR